MQKGVKMHIKNKLGSGTITMLIFTSLLTARVCGQTATRGELRKAIEHHISEAKLGGATIGVFIQAGDTGAILYDHNGEKPLKPASCNKLLTTAAALYYVGPNFRYSTPLYIRGTVDKDTLKGDLVIVGSGDPTISGRFGKDTSDTVWIFHDWANALKKIGIRKITGDIIGDDDYFDNRYFGPAWHPGERGEWYCAEISALSFNDNCVDVHWTAARRVGKPASFYLNPLTSYIKFINGVKTAKKDSEKISHFKRKDKSNVIIGQGSVPIGEKMTDWCSVYNPTLYFTTVLKETLEKEGIKVMGKPVDLDDEPEKKKTLRSDPPTTIVATYTSPPLMRLLDIVHSHSQNFYTEQILKTIGKRVEGEGSFMKGTEAVMDFLRKEGLWENGCVIIDGSGLSHINRTPPKQLVNILRYLSKQPYWRDYVNTLSCGQRKGYLKRRFGETEEERKVAPNIYGKTGYISRVVGLTGVVYNTKGKEIFYSILINGFKGPTKTAREFADKIAFELARSRLP